jgi:two-component system, LytTR family, response regulator
VRKVLIIDDEKRTRDLVLKMINSFDLETESISEGDGVLSGIEAINRHEPDIVLLDIQMADGTGFDILKSIPNRKFEVIFFTAHEEYAIKAIKHSALDYLLKPVDKDELLVAIERALRNLSIRENFESSRSEPLDSHKKRLVLKTLESVYVVELENIIRCEADRNYTTFFLNSGNKIVVSKTLKEYEVLLSAYNFLRVQQSHLINLEYVDRYDKAEGGHVVMKDNSQIPLSPSKRDVFFNILENI